MLLRAVEPSDATRLHALNWRYDVSHLTTPYWRPWSIRDFEELCKADSGAKPSRLVCAIDLGEGRASRLLGLAELAKIGWHHGHAEVGITIWPESDRNKGYGSAAVWLLCQWAFDTLRLRRVQAKVFASNQTALRCFTGLGFTEEGRWRGYFHVKGKATDAVWFGLLEDEWRNLSAPPTP